MAVAKAAPLADPLLREYRVVGGLDTFKDRSFWPRFFSRVVARLQWSAPAIDLTADARAWAELPDERRGRLLELLAGFVVAEDAVAEHLTPYADVARQATLASHESLVAWNFFQQRRDEQRHAVLFDRVAAEVLGLAGETPAERLAAAREHVPSAFLELFEVRLPAVAADLAARRAAILDGVRLYHMVLEGAVFSAGQRALLDDLDDGALPGVRKGVEKVERDERWHVGFGVRCLTEAEDPDVLLDHVLSRATEAAAAWGDAVPPSARDFAVDLCRRRLSIAGLGEALPAA
jgi:ribonucleoside-diphosphate reductase beta chain